MDRWMDRCSPAAAEALGASLCWVGWLGCQKGAEKLGVHRRAVHVLVGTATVLLAPRSKAHQGVTSSPKVARRCGAWQEDGLSPTPSSLGCSRWLPPALSRWGCPSHGRAGPRVTAGCPLLPQPRIPAAPGALAPFFFFFLSSFCP